MKDICCIGHITCDKIVTPRQTTYMPGGTSFYFAHALRHLPPRVTFGLVTKVGTDAKHVIDQLKNDGVDISTFPSKHTVFFENKYGDNLDHRTQRVLAKADPFSIDELSTVEARIYHLGSLLNDDFSPALVTFLSTRGLVSIDAQGFLREVKGYSVHTTRWSDKFDILCSTDILKVNESEMEAITGLNDPHAAARMLASWGVKEVVVTLGSQGSLIMADDQYFDIPAYTPQQVVDATGCGDTYMAGYLYQRVQGRDYATAGRYAAAMCTLKLQHNGPFENAEDDVHAVMNGGIGITLP